MGSLEGLESLLRSHDSIVLFISGKIICGCSKQLDSLDSLAEHITKCHLRVDSKKQEEEEETIQEHFRRNFSFPQENKNAISITLPEDITCVCLGEHDIGAFAANIKCHICHKLCENLDTLNKHIASVHRMSHILVGHNITFEKPDGSVVMPGYFCPMVKCKYHIAESFQRKYFKTLKLLKQHYVKVHASKDFSCKLCHQRFASQTYLDLHVKACGRSFECGDCGYKFQSLESLQTHCRRKNHLLNSIYKKAKQTPRTKEPEVVADKLSVGGTCRKTGEILIAPRPSPMHINAAIALSELSATQIFTPRADIGIQTDSDHWRHKKSSSPPDLLHISPKVTAETQTKAGSRKRAWRPDKVKVSSQVQTTGEYTVRPKISRLNSEPGSQTNTETQCRMSPAKKMTGDSCSVTTMTNMCNVLDICQGQVDIQDCDYLWPLRCNTNGTQTSPRVSSLVREIEDDKEDELAMPGLETVEMMSKPKLGESRQFSTETQTELDIFLDNYEPGLTDVEKLLTTEIQTQTTEDDDSLLLFANNYTQTGTEDFLSALIIGGERRSPSLVTSTANPLAGNPFKLDYVCSAETQTRLTGFQENNLLLQQVMGHRSLDSTETQTHSEIVDFMEM